MTLRLLHLSCVIAALFLFCAEPLMAQKVPDPVPEQEPEKPDDTAAMPQPEPLPSPEPAPVPAPEPSTSAPPVILTLPEGAASIDAALQTIAARFEAGEAEEFTTMLEQAPEGLHADTLGHLLFMRRHIDRAAWFFGMDVLRDPADAASLNNFAAMLFELHQFDPAGADPTWLPAAIDAARNAAMLAPESAPVHNTLGNIARALGQTSEAESAGMRATELAPDEALYWTNLARSRAAAGDLDGAAAALARAHALDPNGPAVRFTAAALPTVAAPYLQQLSNQCDVNFRCQEICPRSIIGGLMSVTCELENSSAQLACQAGRPYPTSYNCQEDFPEYGILIPGLNSGFSISLPGFSAHVLVDGNGDVRVRVEGGINRGRIGVYAGADGTWSPSNGASFDEFRGGVRVNILPTTAGGGSAGDQTAGAWGHPPAHIELEGNTSGETTLGLEAYNAGLISN